jgi:hypothetical protein
MPVPTPRIEWSSAVVNERDLSLVVPLSGVTEEWRELLRLYLAREGDMLASAAWSEILVVANDIVVREVSAGYEERLREVLDRIIQTVTAHVRRDRLIREPS